MIWLAAFIPLFVAVDPIGLVPVFLALTEQMTPQRRRGVTFEAIGFALLIAVLFMLAGSSMFGFLHITEADFRIAGGIILLVLAVIDLLIPGKPAINEQDAVGLFPLATPLIAGPATLTTTLVLARNPLYGYRITSICLAVNFAILLFVLLGAAQLARWIGMNAMRAVSKLVMVLLAAIAINLIRSGIVMAWREVHLG